MTKRWQNRMFECSVSVADAASLRIAKSRIHAMYYKLVVQWLACLKCRCVKANQNTAGVLARVKRGEHINITERGAVAARLLPARKIP